MKKKGFFNRALDLIEKIGNALPHPATIFGILALLVAILSLILSALNLSSIHPVTGESYNVKSLLSGDGIRWIYSNITYNFIKFPPLGYVLVVMVGIGAAEGSGLFNALIRGMALGAPKKLITATLVFAGILSHVASEAGYVILIPLGAAIFHSIGRHPLAGLAAAFCGVSGGFGANMLITSIDPVLAGLSESAAHILDKNISINAACNIYFSLVSAIVVTIIGTLVTEKIVEPRLGKYEGIAEKVALEKLTAIEKKALRWSGVSSVFFLLILFLTIIPENGIFRNPQTKDVLKSPFFDGLIVGILLFFLIPGLVYGKIVGTIKNDKDLMKHLANSMKSIAGYIVLVFFAAQFVYFFNYSNIGIILAIEGAVFLKDIGFTGIPLAISFVLLAAFINMFMGSASAKWAIMAPIFVPMFMLLGYHPALTQAAFRIGDSITNVITPMMSYFALILTFVEKYDEKYGMGSLISLMLPFTIFLGLGWILLLVLWIFLSLPLGPDSPLHYMLN